MSRQHLPGSESLVNVSKVLSGWFRAHTVSRFEPFVTKLSRSANWLENCFFLARTNRKTHLNDMPYCSTCWKFDFHTRVTSQALVAESRHDKNAETALPPTIQNRFSSMCGVKDWKGMWRKARETASERRHVVICVISNKERNDGSGHT